MVEDEADVTRDAVSTTEFIPNMESLGGFGVPCYLKALTTYKMPWQTAACMCLYYCVEFAARDLTPEEYQIRLALEKSGHAAAVKERTSYFMGLIVYNGVSCILGTFGEVHFNSY